MKLREQYEKYMSPENVEQIRDRLIAIMDHYAWTMAKIARQLDMSPQTICKFIRDREDISFQSLLKVEDYVIEMEQRISQT